MASSRAAATGRTRWKRFGIALVPAVAVISGLGMAAASGAIPLSFAISGTAFKVSADKMVATSVVQYGSVAGTTSHDGKPVILSGFKTADFTNLCQSVKIPLPFSIGGHDSVVMLIKSDTASATDMIADLAQLQGDAEFDGVSIGIDSSTTGNYGPDTGTRPSGFGQTVDKVTVNGAKQTVYAVSASTFKLPNLDLSVNFDNQECF